MAAEKTLDDFYPVERPRERLVMTLIEWNKELNIIEIGFPSWRFSQRINICRYFIGDKSRDYCLCDGAKKYHKRCWHLAWRPIILKAFMNRKEADNTSWLENIELYGMHSVEQIAGYIRALLEFQEEVSQADLLDLELVDYKGENIDRRRIGVAFLNLMKFGEIEKAGQTYAQYARRKGGKTFVWRKRRAQGI